MEIKDCYAMTQEENIFCAKRILVDAIYKQANLEGIAITYAQTVDILNNVNVGSVAPNDINKVCCLRDAWKYVLDDIDSEVDLAFIETVHELVARFDVDYRELGKIRCEDVLISGTSWRPEIPSTDRLFEMLETMKNIPVATDRALKTGLAVMRIQPFKDGNKRVASFVINKLLIANGRGLFNVPVELDGTFKQLLVQYYETDCWDDILIFMRDHCLQGTTRA